MKKSLIYIVTVIFLIGCGSNGTESKTIDIANYYPNKNMVKSFYMITDSEDNSLYDEDISIDKSIITVKVDDTIKRTIDINDNGIIQKDSDDNITKTMKRYMQVGGILYRVPKSKVIEDIKFEDTILGHKSIESTKTCQLERAIDKLDNYDTKYSGDILKFKCIEDKKIITKLKDDLPDYINLHDGEEKSDYDISYFYMKKDVGLIAKIDDDCIVEDKAGSTRVNDISSKCKERRYTHTFYLQYNR